MFDDAVARVNAGVSGPFAGVPYLLKDLVVEASGTRFTEGSVFLRDNASSFDSELVVRLRRAGLVILGKTNTPGVRDGADVRAGAVRPDPQPLGRRAGRPAAPAAARPRRWPSGMVPMAHGNDLGGSLRYPASACGLFGLKPTRGRNPLGPEYGDAIGGNAVEHALTRSVRDSAALLDATAGPALGDPYWAPPPARPVRRRGRRRPRPAAHRLDGPHRRTARRAIPTASRRSRTRPRCASRWATTSWTRSCRRSRPEVGAAIGTGFNAATAWILAYWIRRLGREPEPGELEPLTRAFWEAGRQITRRPTTCMAVRTPRPTPGGWPRSSPASTCG